MRTIGSLPCSSLSDRRSFAVSVSSYSGKVPPGTMSARMAPRSHVRLVVGGSAPGDHELAIGDGVDDLLDLFLFLAVVIGLGVAGHAQHAGGDRRVADHDKAADEVALLPAHPFDVEEGEVHLGRLAAPDAGLVMDLPGLADDLHVGAGSFDRHTPRLP